MRNKLTVISLICATSLCIGSHALAQAHGTAQAPTADTKRASVEQVGSGSQGWKPWPAEFVTRLQTGAADGNARDQYYLGLGYETGVAGRQSVSEALKLYRSAAELGHPPAWVALGRLYVRGHGVPKNDVEAAQWFRRAADKGDYDGMTELGRCYSEGRGVPKDQPRAVRLFEIAAKGGNPDAQQLLGISYFEGNGVAKSLNEAIVWWRRAAEKNHVSSQFMLGLILRDSMVASNYAEALKWLHEVARHGDASAWFQLGVTYEHGLAGVEKDPSKAIDWYKKAAGAGQARASYAIGRIYENGIDGRKNPELAKFHYIKASYGNYKPAGERLDVLNEAEAAENVRTRLAVPTGCRIVYETEPTTDVTNVCDYNSLGPTNCRDEVKSGTRQVSKKVCSGT